MELKNDLFKIGLWLGVILIMLGAMAYFKIGKTGGFLSGGKNSLAVVQTKNFPVELRIDYGGILPTSLSLIQAKTGDKPLPILKAVHKVVTKQTPDGEVIESIEGVASGNDRVWNFYVNDKLANKPVDKYEIKEGDQLLWRLEKPTSK